MNCEEPQPEYSLVDTSVPEENIRYLLILLEYSLVDTLVPEENIRYLLILVEYILWTPRYLRKTSDTCSSY